MAGPVTYPVGPGVIVTRDGQSGLANLSKITFYTGVDAPTEAVLVSGINAATGSYKVVTLTAARLVGAPLNLVTGMIVVITLIQGGAGAFAATWNAVFAGITGGTSGATGTRATFPFLYDGTNLNLIGAQPTWV